ncbi:MAG: Methionyl-tRNA formyltransferase [Nitrospira sp.]|nr:MAG: Methionyl-tRNA formyltransferase [Nitrospira sp.]
MENILLIGMGLTTLSALDSLVSAFNVIGVVRSTEESTTDPVRCRATELGIQLFPSVSPAGITELVRRLHPDCVVVSSYDRILKREVLELSRFVNVHYSPLPQYRGRANVNWAIINGDFNAAITIHEMAPGLDAGNILFQQKIPIRERDTIADLYSALNDVQGKHLAYSVRRFLDGYSGEPQPDEGATYGCTRLPEDGEINWQESTVRIDRLVRALVKPFPGAYTYYKGQRLNVWKATPLANAPQYSGRIPGRVVGVDRREGHVDVLTGDGVFRLSEIQLVGSEITAAASIIRSTKDTLGLRTVDLHERVQALEQQILQIVKRLPVDWIAS